MGSSPAAFHSGMYCTYPHLYCCYSLLGVSTLQKENQQLTPKMSLRRNNILKSYQKLIDEIYAEENGYQLRAD